MIIVGRFWDLKVARSQIFNMMSKVKKEEREEEEEIYFLPTT